MKRILFIAATMLCVSALGQSALTHYFPAGQADANILVKSYVTPMAEDFGTLANNGWYTTGATHKRFGFDIGVTLNSVFLTDSRKSYSPPQLANTDYDGTLNTSGSLQVDKIPTIYGNKVEIPNFNVKASAAQNPGTPFQGPDGIYSKKDYPTNSQVLPTIQAGIGLFANTDLRIRYTPQFTVNGIKMSSVGGALMHDIKQHIPGLKLVPFSMSVLLGYTQLTGSVDLSGTYTGSGQAGKTNTTATTAQLLISKSLAIVTFYGGFGYNAATTKFDVNGTYNVNHAVTALGDVALTNSFNLTDPYKYSFKTSGVKATLGMRLKLGPFFLNGDYSFYKSQKLLTVGTGFTFR